MVNETRPLMSNIKWVTGSKITKEMVVVNQVTGTMETLNITEPNNLLYAEPKRLLRDWGQQKTSTRRRSTYHHGYAHYIRKWNLARVQEYHHFPSPRESDNMQKIPLQGVWHQWKRTSVCNWDCPKVQAIAQKIILRADASRLMKSNVTKQMLPAEKTFPTRFHHLDLMRPNFFG